MRGTLRARCRSEAWLRWINRRFIRPTAPPRILRASHRHRSHRGRLLAPHRPARRRPHPCRRRLCAPAQESQPARHRLVGRRTADPGAAGRVRRDDAGAAAPLRLPARRPADRRLARQRSGTRLAANSDRPRQPFTFFMLRDRQINAFATLGGYIGINAGLVLAAEREDEVAGVLVARNRARHPAARAARRRTRPARPVADPAGDARRDRRRAAGAGGNSERRRRAGRDGRRPWA